MKHAIKTLEERVEEIEKRAKYWSRDSVVVASFPDAIRIARCMYDGREKICLPAPDRVFLERNGQLVPLTGFFEYIFNVWDETEVKKHEQ